MGHSEMLLAVAGFNKQQIDRDTRSLASGDWSRFPQSERVAMRFARKQARTPAAIMPADVQTLVRQVGQGRALDIIWWSCHCHYLTRIANAFQLPLERANVFDGFAASKTKPEPVRAARTVQKATSVMK